jgi:hypothetical protein
MSPGIWNEMIITIYETVYANRDEKDQMFAIHFTRRSKVICPKAIHALVDPGSSILSYHSQFQTGSSDIFFKKVIFCCVHR